MIEIRKYRSNRRLYHCGTDEPITLADVTAWILGGESVQISTYVKKDAPVTDITRKILVDVLRARIGQTDVTCDELLALIRR